MDRTPEPNLEETNSRRLFCSNFPSSGYYSTNGWLIYMVDFFLFYIFIISYFQLWTYFWPHLFYEITFFFYKFCFIIIYIYIYMYIHLVYNIYMYMYTFGCKFTYFIYESRNNSSPGLLLYHPHKWGKFMCIYNHMWLYIHILTHACAYIYIQITS